MIQNVINFFHDYGPLGLFIHSFIDAIFFPIPAFFLQVSLSMLNPSSALLLATVGYIACLLGTPIGYLIGKVMGKPVLYKLLKAEWVDAATARFQKSGETAILIGSFTPIPFKVFTILSGCMNFPLWRLIGYAAIGRAVKFYVVGVLFYFYGKAAESMVSNVSIYIFLGSLPLIGIYLWLRKRKQKKQAAEKLASQVSTSEDATQADVASEPVVSEQTVLLADSTTEASVSDEQEEDKLEHVAAKSQGSSHSV